MPNLDEETWHPEPVFRIWCSKHNVDLDEVEHYDYWFLCADTSGWSCPKQEGDEDCSEHWKLSPIGRDDIDIFDIGIRG